MTSNEVIHLREVVQQLEAVLEDRTLDEEDGASAADSYWYIGTEILNLKRGSVQDEVQRLVDDNKTYIEEKLFLHRDNSSLREQNRALRERLEYAAETFDMLDDHTHANIECDAVAAACRELL